MGEKEMISLILALSITADTIPVDSFDMVELNHVHSRGTGNYRFTQVIGWEFREGEWYCEGWTTVDREAVKNAFASAGRTHHARFVDSDGRRYFLHFGAFKETRTAYDPEQVNRAKYPIRSRRNFIGRKQWN